ncbi:MAG: YbaB/EbfC family nucleoid-associated protein [Nitrospinota bacterium]|nr:YbaB/EbfC family nucleoid-associated protein [Nitrospinota bacterium]MDH5677349.1 YbaB/EbfC family nucleoid-associated protein [Nitrospinota bacterium]MDH5757822.1 YbaB/EbfC family nucleoid-associated protein [Nitrospinota bacterium]
MKGFGNMMRQAQQVQKKLAEAQEELKTQTVEAEAGQGKVKAVVTMGYQLKSVAIDKDLLDPEDPDTLQDLITLAVNDGLEKARKAREEELGKISGGLAGMIPGLI